MLTAAFMKPEIFKGKMIVGEDSNGESFMYPEEYFTKEQVRKEVGKVNSIGIKAGWFGRLSASGYMDSTDWAGPFASEKACEDYLQEMYGEDEEENL